LCIGECVLQNGDRRFLSILGQSAARSRTASRDTSTCWTPPTPGFGDFCAFFNEVDEATANYLRKEVSDGIVAPFSSLGALEILRAKKGVKFIILEAKADYQPGDVEYREVYGMTFAQKCNDVVIGKENVCSSNIVTNKATTIDDAAARDLILASICVTYKQSNSVGFARTG
jgi:phosphoribosylaminoimidazolecarboxamide formyltransferase/IMP cyclohydrolase